MHLELGTRVSRRRALADHCYLGQLRGGAGAPASRWVVGDDGDGGLPCQLHRRRSGVGGVDCAEQWRPPATARCCRPGTSVLVATLHQMQQATSSAARDGAP